MALLPFPALPAPPSWYPGHMTHFARRLPMLLRRTDVVVEVRDARLPLTSINRNFEGALQKWRQERGGGATACERIVVFSKRDLVGDWGIEPFRRAMHARYPDQTLFFVASNAQHDVRALHRHILDFAKRNPNAPETNVLVVGMPNVGKSTLLNALRRAGAPGPVAKALQTSALPGMTRAVSNRLRLAREPPVYAFDSPGVMLPFLGRGEAGAERGAKLALIAGIKEGLYDLEPLAAYLVYRLAVLNPSHPAYMPLLSPSAQKQAEPLADAHDVLAALAARLHMLQRGGTPDLHRAAEWLIRWWREKGGRLAASSPSLSLSPSSQTDATPRRGWGFDFEWPAKPGEGADEVQKHMEACIAEFEAGAGEEEEVSVTQERKAAREELIARRVARMRAKAPGAR